MILGISFANTDFVIIAAPINYDPQKNFFDGLAVEAMIELVLKSSDRVVMVITSTIPIGYTKSIRKKYNTDRIIVGCDEASSYAAEIFSRILVEGAVKANKIFFIRKPCYE